MNCRSSGSWLGGVYLDSNIRGSLQATITVTAIGFEVRIDGNLIHTYNHRHIIDNQTSACVYAFKSAFYPCHIIILSIVV